MLRSAKSNGVTGPGAERFQNLLVGITATPGLYSYQCNLYLTTITNLR